MERGNRAKDAPYLVLYEEDLMKLTDRELATMLAALRLFQEYLFSSDKEIVGKFPHFDEHEPLNPDEIDDLCERLNCEHPFEPKCWLIWSVQHHRWRHSNQHAFWTIYYEQAARFTFTEAIEICKKGGFRRETGMTLKDHRVPNLTMLLAEDL